MSVECPTCGDSDFDEQKAMRIHHKLAHGESISGFDKTCQYCGDEFEAMMSETKYCSEHCFGKDNATGESNPSWSGGKTTLTCEYCESEYKVTPAKSEDSRFCSQRCLSEWRSENERGEDHPSYSSISVNCDNCGGTFTRQPHAYTKDGNHFCDQDCFGEWKSEHHRGEDHPCYKGGSVDRRGDWYQKRRETLARDNYECRACGTTREEHYNQYDRDLEVHHVVPVREFNDPTDANSLGNLVTACIPCHRQYEGLPVFPA